jgi:hypothetical protein
MSNNADDMYIDISGNHTYVVKNNTGENWDESNLETLSDWVHIGSLQIETLDLVIKKYRSLIRKNVLLGLILSTASGSISITQLSSSEQIFILNVFFTIMSFSIAILTGLIKIYQVQERLEEYIQLKQEWITFCVNITSEIQLPISQRRDALKLIKEYKGKYLDLLKIDVDVPTAIKEQALENLYDDDKMIYMEERNDYRKLKNEINNGIFDGENGSSNKHHHPHKTKETEEAKRCFESFFSKLCKKKFDGRKTSLSNIILTIVMDEEKTERDKHIAELMKVKIDNKIKKTEKEKPEQYQMHLPDTTQHILEV